MYLGLVKIGSEFYVWDFKLQFYCIVHSCGVGQVERIFHKNVRRKKLSFILKRKGWIHFRFLWVSCHLLFCDYTIITSFPPLHLASKPSHVPLFALSNSWSLLTPIIITCMYWYTYKLINIASSVCMMLPVYMFSRFGIWYFITSSGILSQKKIFLPLSGFLSCVVVLCEDLSKTV